MSKFGELFKREKYPDTIKPMIDEMNKLSENMNYEKAKVVLDSIKEELKKSESNFPFQIDTIRDVHDLVRSNPIRLDPENYKFSDYLGLLINIHDRREELKGKKYSDIDHQRKVVAEEMACLGITVPAKKGGIKPNRRFLDIANNVNPFIACKELKRRETVLLWKAIERGHKEEIDKVRKRLGSFVPR